MRNLTLILVALVSLALCSGCAKVKAKGEYEASTGYTKK